MSIKIIAFDIDGTIVADDHMTIHKDTISSFKKAHEQGIKLVMSTGRTVRLGKEEADQIGCVDYFIMSNGAIVADNNGNELKGHYIPADEGKIIYDILVKHNAVFQIYAGCKGYVNQHSYDHVLEADGLPEKFLIEYRERMEPIQDMYKMMEVTNIEKFNVDFVNPEKVPEIMEELSNIPDLFYTAGFKGNIEIVKKGADKGAALAWLANELGVGPEDVMAFGDSGNDVTMLEWAGKSYAMINGNDKAKSAAKYVTERNNNDGGVGCEVFKILN